MNELSKWSTRLGRGRCHLIRRVKQVLLPSVKSYASNNKSGGKLKSYTLYGILTVTVSALTSGGVLLLNSYEGQRSKLWWVPHLSVTLSVGKKNNKGSKLKDSSSFDTTYYVGLDDDWLVYSSSPSPNDIGYRIQLFVTDLINFNVNKVWDWLFPWEQSKSDDPWVLLELTKSSNFWIRQMGVASLASKTKWAYYKYRIVAQSCDPRTTVALARYPYANDAYFLPVPKLHPSKNDILSDLKHQLSLLPAPKAINSCIFYYRFIALEQEVRFQKDPLAMDPETLLYSLPEEEEKKKKKAIGHCLEAIASYTAIPDCAVKFVNNQGLSVLQRLYEENTENWVQTYVATILANLSQVPDLLDTIVRTGWVSVLRQWLHSGNAAVSLLATTILANLDRDWMTRDVYQDMVLLHPTQRNSQPVYADVVLVHGLRGGAVRTWRQRDSSPVGKQSPYSRSPCWPKDWLASDVPNIRIISIGYNSILHRWGDSCPYEQEKRTIEGRSRELMAKLKQAGVGSRPIIWVGHSMGGLLIKQILALSEREEDISKFASQTRGVLFYSVPHHGASIVDVMMYAKYLVFPSVEVQEMNTSSPKLNKLHQEFLDFVNKTSVPCLSFGENTKTNFGPALPKLMVVPADSSNPGVGQFVTLQANHINTCKPCDEKDEIYKMTCNFIRDVLKTAR